MEKSKRTVVIVEKVSNGFLVTKQGTDEVFVFATIEEAQSKVSELL